MGAMIGAVKHHSFDRSYRGWGVEHYKTEYSQPYGLFFAVPQERQLRIPIIPSGHSLLITFHTWGCSGCVYSMGWKSKSESQVKPEKTPL